MKIVFLRIVNADMNVISFLRRVFLLVALALTVPLSCCWAQREGQKELLARAYWEKSVNNSRDPNKLQELMTGYESGMRSDFLSWAASVREHHRGMSWDYQTGPWVYGIILDAQLQRAGVLYYYRFVGYQATLLKEQGEWRVAKVVSTWIE